MTRDDNNLDIFTQHVLPLFEEYRGDWLTRARVAAHTIGLRKDAVTIDDVRDVCPPPAKADPRVMGAVFTRKEWDCIGYVKSDRSTCHGRPIGVFRLRERGALGGVDNSGWSEG